MSETSTQTKSVEENFSVPEQLEGYLISNVNVDFFGNVKMKKNWFYYANDSLYIKINKDDIWFTHSLPKSSIVGLKTFQNDPLSFEIQTLYVYIFCTASDESEFTKWTQNMNKIIEKKDNSINVENFLNEYYNNKNNINNFSSSLVKEILLQAQKWKVSKPILIETLMNELYKVETQEPELFIDKPLQGKKQVIVNEKDLEKYRLKAEKVEKLEAEILDLTKKLTKLTVNTELKSLAEEELENYKLVNIKLQNFIKQKEIKIGELINNEAKLKVEILESEKKLEEAKKIEEKVKQEKLEFLSIQTKNQQLEAFVKIQELQIEKLKKDLGDNKRESIELSSLTKTLQKFKEREKQLVTLIQNYEEKLKIPHPQSQTEPKKNLDELDLLLDDYDKPKETDPTEKLDRLPLSPRSSDNALSPRPGVMTKSTPTGGSLWQIFKKKEKDPVIIHDIEKKKTQEKK